MENIKSVNVLNRDMQASTRVMLTLLILVVLVGGLYAFTDWFSKVTGFVLGDDEKLELAECLTQKNSVFYVSSTCPACTSQLELFGNEAFSKIDVFTCVDVEGCPAEGGVPAWRINGEFHYGEKGLRELMDISGC